MRTATTAVIAALACAIGTTAAPAQSYPSRTIRMVVPQAPGGVTDVIARAVAQRLATMWNQQVVVENKPGANYQIGSAAVARAEPDGHTLLVTSEAFTINPLISSNLPYDSQKDLTPITGLILINHGLVANPAVPANTVPELIAVAKKASDPMNYATYGVASTGHLNMEMLQHATGARLTPVHYKGAPAAFNDVMAGHVPMMLVSVGTVVEPWRAGKVKLLAVGSQKRLPSLPEVPTIAEAGLPGFRAQTWFGLFTTGGTSPEIVAKINRDVQQIFADAAFRERYLAPQLFEPLVTSSEEFSAFLKAESERWGKVIRDANIKIGG